MAAAEQVPFGKDVPLGLEGEAARGRLGPSKRRVWGRGQWGVILGSMLRPGSLGVPGSKGVGLS